MLPRMIGSATVGYLRRAPSSSAVCLHWFFSKTHTISHRKDLLTGQISIYIGTPVPAPFTSTPIHDAESAVDGLGCYPTASYMALGISRPLHTPDVDCALHRILSVDRIAREIVEIFPEIYWSSSAMSGVNRGLSSVNMLFAKRSFWDPNTARKVSTWFGLLSSSCSSIGFVASTFSGVLGFPKIF
ncbi:hypothetical protein ACEPAG_8783 [Sanghuangporus baumii]